MTTADKRAAAIAWLRSRRLYYADQPVERARPAITPEQAAGMLRAVAAREGNVDPALTPKFDELQARWKYIQRRHRETT